VREHQIVIVGGGAAGCFAASACAAADAHTRVTVLERGPELVSKVRISGGGRCNVTHACFDPHALSQFYPRGGRELRGAFHVFQPRDTVAWFESRGVRLKTEPDGRMFPVTDSSQTILDCLVNAARQLGVRLHTNQAVTRISRPAGGGFELEVKGEGTLRADRVLLATGGCRALAGGQLAVDLGHSLQEPVPSLFTFELGGHWLQRLAGIALEADVRVVGAPLRERGPVLLTHRGLSGPAVLRLSAWGARRLKACDYRFPLRVNWLPDRNPEAIAAELAERRATQPARRVMNAPLAPLPARFWEAAVTAAGIGPEIRWADLSRAAQHQLILDLTAAEVIAVGKSLNKEEFVTCGGVSLREVDFTTMQSRVCPGLHLAGEVLDLDGLTGGFNFQAAWTTGWIAGRSMALDPI
jgi:hypothetical protein